MIRLLFGLLGRFQRTGGQSLRRVGVLTFALVCYASSGFLYFELAEQPDLTWSDALWWSVVTMTTVGYGDLFPTSVGGRYLVGVPVMFFGVSILGYLLSMVASFLVEERARHQKGLLPIMQSGHLLLIHCPSVERVARIVDELRADTKTQDSGVVLVDPDLEVLPEQLADRGIAFVRGDPTDEAVLERASVKTASQAIILARDPQDPRSDHASLAVTLTLEKIWPDLHTVAECVEAGSVKLLERCGCDSVVCMGELTNPILVQEALDPGVKDLVMQLTSNTVGQQLYLVPASGLGSDWGSVAATLAQRGALALALKGPDEMQVNPKNDRTIGAEHLVMCIAATRPV